jgi:hypothetical protein
VKNKKHTAQSAFFNLRALVGLLVCGAAASSMLSGALLAFFHPEALANRSQRTLTFAERVAYQRAIEGVYWRHQIWPKERPDPKPSLDAEVSQEQLEKKVEDYLRKSQALEDYWQRPITVEQLQAEMDRMAKHTKQPEVLRELFEALGNDAFVIAECLARPALAERLLTGWYAYDERIHGELRRRAQVELRAYNSVEQMKQTSGTYSEIKLIKSGRSHREVNRGAGHTVELNSRDWNETIQKLAGMFNDVAVVAGVQRARSTAITPIGTRALSRLQQDETRYYVTAVISKTDNELEVATVSWAKEPLDSWLAQAENQAG